MAEFEDIKYKINIRDIKSSFIIKRIFSFLYEKQMYKLIINNKELQKMFLIGIEDYKKISQIYKIVEKNGKGKEYLINTNTISFILVPSSFKEKVKKFEEILFLTEGVI